MPRILRFGTYDALVTTLLFSSIALTCGLTPMQGDTWWQLRAGRDMWMSKQVLLTDTYSHTAYGSFWPNHEWLAEVIFFLLYRVGGLPALTLFAAALIAGGWGLTWRLTNGSARHKVLLIGLAVVSSAGWWEPRPHAFSLLFIPTLVFLLMRDQTKWLPLVFLLWANVHGGVLLGLVLLGVGVAAQTMVDPTRWRRSVLVVLLSALAVTATPLGLSFWTEIPKSLQRIRLYPLDEWMRPSVTEIALLPFWIIAVGLCAALLRNLRRLPRAPCGEAALYACTAVLLVAAISAVRNVGPFLMLAVPALTRLMPVRFERPVSAAPERRALNLTVLVVALAGVGVTLAWAYRNRIDRLMWDPVPSGALSALQQCPDNLYNRYDEGGALLWFAPDRRVFVDGRQDPYPAALVLEHIQMETGQVKHDDVFARHQIRCAYLPVISPVAQRLIATGWNRLYSDRRWLVLSQ